MAVKKPKRAAKTTRQPTRQSLPSLNVQAILDKKYSALSSAVFVVIFLIYSLSVFKNISYPLFWADESITAVGGQRVLEFGYPKVHDGKNVFYDLRHNNAKLGIDEKTDAYVGGTGWLHYYIAAIAIKIAELSGDIYTKTGIIRSIFALIGLAAMLLFVFLLSRLFGDRFSKFLFAFLFFSMCLFSISLTLLLREVRYYSPSIFLVCFIAGFYPLARFRGGHKKWFAVTSTIALVLLFHTFPPVYFILIATLGISEAVLIFFEWLKKDKLKPVLVQSLSFTLPIFISLVMVMLCLPYFRTFEIAGQMAIFNARNSPDFFSKIQDIVSYFWRYELLWLAIIVKILVAFRSKALLKSGDPKFKTSLFFSLLLVVYCLAITRIPNFIYTRYFCPCIVILNATILLDLFCLHQFYQPKTLPSLRLKTITLSMLGFLVFAEFISQNSAEISGHISEMSEPYKGPLDFTIPYLRDHYKRTADLVIATNYEESSFMFYLNSKVIVGFVGNNLSEDTLLRPEVISIRKTWSFNRAPLDSLLKKARYTRVSFPVADNPVNNIPELNFMTGFNHVFETQTDTSELGATDLYLKQAK